MVALELDGPTDLHGLLEAESRPLFFVVISNSELELGLLRRWVCSVRPDIDLENDRVGFVVGDRNGPPADGDRLDRLLDGIADETLVVPLRVLWLPSAEHSRWHRLLGSMHRPGALRQYLALRFSPGRCATVFNIGELSGRMQTPTPA